MTIQEELDLLRREIADLRDRVRALAAKSAAPVGPVNPYTPVERPILPTASWPAWVPPNPNTCVSEVAKVSMRNATRVRDFLTGRDLGPAD